MDSIGGAINENEQEDQRDLGEVFKKKIVTFFSKGALHSTANTKAQEVVNINQALPRYIPHGGIASGSGVGDRALGNLFQKLDRKRKQRVLANDQQKRDFVKRCVQLEGKWQNEDEFAVHSLNLPKLDVEEIGSRVYHRRGLERIYCSPDYPMTRTKKTMEYKPNGCNIVLPMAKLHLGKTEIHAGDFGKMYVAKTPVTVDMDPRMLGRDNDVYCGKDRRFPKEDERFIALDKQLSELPWNKKKSVLYLLEEDAKRKLEEARYRKAVTYASPNISTNNREKIKWATPLTMKLITPKVPAQQTNQETQRATKELYVKVVEINAHKDAGDVVRDVAEDDVMRQSPADDTHTEDSVVKDAEEGEGLAPEQDALSPKTEGKHVPKQKQPPAKAQARRRHVFHCCSDAKTLEATPMQRNKTIKRVRTRDKPPGHKNCERRTHAANVSKTMRSPSADHSPPPRGSKSGILRDVKTKQWKDITKEYGIGLLRSCEGGSHRPRTLFAARKRPQCHFPSLRREQTVM